MQEKVPNARVTNPEDSFTSPAEIAKDRDLSRDQKVAALQNWALSVRRRVDSVSEGMTTYPEGTYTNLHRC